MSKAPTPDPPEEVQRRVDDLRQKFAEQQGREFVHFYCPILLVDELAELCRGHIIPEKLGVSNKWVPQRAHLDSFYGSIAEAAFIALTTDQKLGPITILSDPAKRRRHRPTMTLGDKVVEVYFPKDITKIPDDHTAFRMVADDGRSLGFFAAKISPEDAGEIADGSEQKCFTEVNKDYTAAAMAMAIKAAHLTMFYLFEYKWVFSVPGNDLAGILSRFYLQHKDKGANEADLHKYFQQYKQMVKPYFRQGILAQLAGTLDDKRIAAVFNASGDAFIYGIAVNAGGHFFLVWVPPSGYPTGGSGQLIDSYFSFLSHPPSSIVLGILEWDGNSWQSVGELVRTNYEANA